LETVILSAVGMGLSFCIWFFGFVLGRKAGIEWAIREVVNFGKNNKKTSAPKTPASSTAPPTPSEKESPLPKDLFANATIFPLTRENLDRLLSSMGTTVDEEMADRINNLKQKLRKDPEKAREYIEDLKDYFESSPGEDCDCVFCTAKRAAARAGGPSKNDTPKNIPHPERRKI
jgi:hypothetical protein